MASGECQELPYFERREKSRKELALSERGKKSQMEPYKRGKTNSRNKG